MAPATHVARGKQILAVAAGYNYSEAAQKSGRISGDAVSHLVNRFNRQGLNAILPRHGGGPAIKDAVSERARILQEARRKPTPEADGTVHWSLSLLCQAVRKAQMVCRTSAIRTVLLEAGFSWQNTRRWCEAGQAVRKRKRGKVIVTDPDATAKKT